MGERTRYWTADWQELDETGLPVHLLMTVDIYGGGPLCLSAPACGDCEPPFRVVCWCGKESCVRGR